MRQHVKHGITLPEILMVLLILGLVAATFIPRFVYSDEIKANECASNVTLINASLDHYFTRTGGRCPTTTAEIERLILTNREEFPSGMPKCPSGRPYEYDASTGHIIAHQH
jgi:prepilin-type N-terminal cleavage/methylation domain-containing protein